VSSKTQDAASKAGDLSQLKGSPATPKACMDHQRPNQAVMPGWMEFVLLALGIIGFVIAMVLFH
jgi:hypothetical protein